MTLAIVNFGQTRASCHHQQDGEGIGMEIVIVGSIRTPFGEVELIPQDRNLLEVSSVEPLQFGDRRIHLWAMLERIHEVWSISGIVEPVLHLIDGPGHTSSIAGESIAGELMKPVTLLAAEWAGAHPEAFECAAAEAFKFDKEGLFRELGVLRESLTCAAQAIESITSEAPSENSARLREYSQKMRSMAFEVPSMQKITEAISHPDEDPSQLTDLLHLASWGAPAANPKTDHLRDLTGWHKGSRKPVGAGSSVPGQSLSINHLTLGQILRKQRKDIGLSQRELALRLGVKAGLVAKLETDCRQRPSFQLLSRVASVLGLDKEQLFQLAETEAHSSSGARKAITHPRDGAQVWGAFSLSCALLDRYNVKPQELKALSQVSLMGKITGSEALLFILDAIRESGDTEE
jgi:transcriptional regulator with XRE-family HTH domain